MRIGIIGAGTLAQGLLVQWRASKKIYGGTFWGVTKTKKSANTVSKRFHIPCNTKISPILLSKTDVVVLGVKPYQLEEAADALIKAGLKPKTLIISILAGIPPAQLSAAFGGENPVVVAMTNTPSIIGEGMTGLFFGPKLSPRHKKLAEKLFSISGKVRVFPVNLFHEVTALSGSGPAFVYKLIEEMAMASVSQGMPKTAAIELASQTFKGASQMILSSGLSPEKLRSQVTTPGGCTAEGLKALKKAPLRGIFSSVLRATRRKSKDLA